MKIKEIKLQNYKRFVEPTTISFCDEDGEVNDMTLLVGDNGSGKSSVLQAIVMVLNTAARPSEETRLSDYPGFVYKHIQTGDMPAKIDITLSFLSKENEATLDYANRLKSKGGVYADIQIPALLHSTTSLRFDTSSNDITGDADAAVFQTRGHGYAEHLSQYVENPRSLLDSVGTIYFYTEQRSAYSIKYQAKSTKNIEELRDLLVKLSNFHIAVKANGKALQKGQQNFYETLENNYRKIFPSRSFVGASPDFKNPFAPAEFWLSDGKNHYELAEMSAGERAIFPLLVDFSLNNINNSIIIIDEIELHLHPPLQQALLDALPKLGNNNQFIITTHSDYITTMFKPSQIIRLKP